MVSVITPSNLLPGVPGAPVFLKPAQAAKILEVSEGTLAIWRTERTVALDYCKIGGAIRYELSDIIRFAAERKVKGLEGPPKHLRGHAGPGRPKGSGKKRAKAVR